jgi:hypothetical protein
MWFLVLAHFLGDYAFQTDRMAQCKGKHLPCLLVHTTIYTLTIGIVYYFGRSLSGNAVDSLPLLFAVCMGIFLLHSAQDLIKARWFSCSRQMYYLDQALHVLQLFVIRLWLG